MEDSSRMSPTPRTFVSLWLGAVPSLVAGLAAGGSRWLSAARSRPRARCS